MTYLEIKDKYPEFIYDKYEINENDEEINITYYFEIPNLAKFTPSLKLFKKDIENNNFNRDFFNDLVFHIGLVELISYWKVAMPHEVVINAGYLDENQIKWFKKLYYNGLGEFFYQNDIHISEDDFMKITCFGKKSAYEVNYLGNGNLIPIGGGKDSIVTINLLKDYLSNSKAFIINPKEVHLECAKKSNLDSIIVNRFLDKRLIELNSEGFLNGHTPFSSLVSFVSLLSAYLANKKYIILSNEASANEGNVVGENVNHQYSKSYEYECDFNSYVTNYFKVDIKYFSLLRPLSELQIASLFAKCKEYHSIFKSCNVGSKALPWKWCCACPKCLFVYIILSPFLKKEELINIFGEELFAKEDLLETFLELIGKSKHKPFECVGTYEEVNYSICKTINNYEGNLPYLLDYYKNNYPLEYDDSILHCFNDENNVPLEYIDIVRRSINE